MTSREQALIAINEALRALDHIPYDLDDDRVDEARTFLAYKREDLTDKPWPEFPALDAGSDEYAAWFELRAIGQGREGLL